MGSRLSSSIDFCWNSWRWSFWRNWAISGRGFVRKWGKIGCHNPCKVNAFEHTLKSVYIPSNACIFIFKNGSVLSSFFDLTFSLISDPDNSPPPIISVSLALHSDVSMIKLSPSSFYSTSDMSKVLDFSYSFIWNTFSVKGVPKKTNL